MLLAAVCTLHSGTRPARTSLRPWHRLGPAEKQAAPRALAELQRRGARRWPSGSAAGRSETPRAPPSRPLRPPEGWPLGSSPTASATSQDQTGTGLGPRRDQAGGVSWGPKGLACAPASGPHAAPETRGRVRPGLGWPPPGPALSLGPA